MPHWLENLVHFKVLESAGKVPGWSQSLINDVIAAVDGDPGGAVLQCWELNVWVCDLQGGILLLTGPSGCGKTTTVRVLSRELNIRIQEWTNSSNLESYSSSQHGKS